jgi:hypothetical protein
MKYRRGGRFMITSNERRIPRCPDLEPRSRERLLNEDLGDSHNDLELRS